MKIFKIACVLALLASCGTANNYIQWEVFDEMVNLYDTARFLQ